jgi:hypothetical protein
VHAFVVGLRRKIECDPKRPVLLLNVPRIGYRLTPEPGGSPILATDARPAEGKGGASP